MRALTAAKAGLCGAGVVIGAMGAALAQDSSAIPDIARALLQAGYDTKDAEEIAAVVKAVKTVFPDYAEAIDAEATAKLYEMAQPNAPQLPNAQTPIAEIAAQTEPAPNENAMTLPIDATPPPRPNGFFAMRPWDGKISASGVFSDGNSENLAGGIAVDASRKAGSIVHNLKGFFDIGRSRGETNQKRWGASYQLDFDIADATYAYGRISYEEDEFSGFDYRIFVGAGLGHFFYDTDRFVWKAEGGPGFRYSLLDNTPETEEQGAVYASNEIEWTIRDGVVLEQDLNATWTTPTTTLFTKTELTTALTEALSTGLSFEYRYETDPPSNRENFDAIARASLKYGF